MASLLAGVDNCPNWLNCVCRRRVYQNNPVQRSFKFTITMVCVYLTFGIIGFLAIFTML